MNDMRDLTERLHAAIRELIHLADTPTITLAEKYRLLHKAEGVRLALSYVSEYERRADA